MISHVESKTKNKPKKKKKWTFRYREQTGGCQRQRGWGGSQNG